MCVLAEAVSRSTSEVHYLLNKDVRVVSNRYASLNRPWLCGVGDLGTGKSHAAEPHVQLAIEASEQCDGFAVGAKHDRFSVIIAWDVCRF